MRVQELFTHGEGISTPRAHHEGWHPLIECAKHDFKIVYFPFFFLFFWGRQGDCHCFYVSSGAMKNSNLHSSFKSESLCYIDFIFFEILILIANKSRLRCWTLKRSFDFWKEERIVIKALDLETISNDIW